MADPRKSKYISSADAQKFIALSSNDITTSFIMDTFGTFNGKPKYNPYDLMIVPPNSYGKPKKNKNQFTTTLGLFIFNKFFVEDELIHVLGYVNETVGDDMFSDINKKLSYALLEDRITVQQMKTYLNKTQKTMPEMMK